MAQDPPEPIAFLPVWKAGATPHERFMELARMAEARPDRFREVAIVWFELPPPDDPTRQRYRYICAGANGELSIHDVLGLFSMGTRLAQDFALKP